MNPERRRQVDQIVASAQEVDPERQAIFLDGACGGDESLRREVESLLTAILEAGSFLEEPITALQTKPPAIAQEAAIGQIVSHYRIVSLLGRGGMGEVYLARDLRLRRQVALKLLRPYVTSDEDRVRRFRREAHAASALNHPNILTIHDIGQADNVHFIATEFIEGETLGRRLVQTRLSFAESLEVAIQVSSALAAAHQAGIVHRDIKPENIMLRPDGYVKVLDFGIAKLIPNRQAVDTAVSTLELIETSQNMIIGSPAYMSPEQARGLAVDARTDIFSLGIVLYEMIAGVSPFAGPTLSDTLVAILEKEPPPLAQRAPDAPAELQHIVSRALCKDRQERYQTISELIGDLKPLKQRLDFQQNNQSTVDIPKIPPVQQEPVQQEEGSQTKTSSVESLPTLILSHFVPNEEPGRDQLHYRDASLIRSGTDQLRYRSHIEAGQFVIEPDDPYLDTVRSGGEICLLNFWHSPWERTFTFPALDIKLVNNTDKTIFFHEVILRVRKSKLDPRPIPIIYGTDSEMTLPLFNIGWGPMEDCELRFALLNRREQNAHGSKSTEESQYPFELKFGDVEEAPDNLSLDSYFESLEEQSLSAFPYREALIVGELEYGQTDPQGNKSRRTNKLTAVVKLRGWALVPRGQIPAGGVVWPSYSYQIRLEVEGEDYTRTVPISHSLGAGETDRFLIFVAAEKSSIHEFDLAFRYNETEQLESRPVKLEMFLSRLDANYIEEKERDLIEKNNHRGLPSLNTTEDSQSWSSRWFDLPIGIIAAIAPIALIILLIWILMPRPPVTVNNPPVVAARLLDYSIRVQKYRNGRPYEAPFTVAGADIIFEKDYRIKLNLTSPQSGYFYVVSEPPVKAGDRLRYILLSAASTVEPDQRPLNIEIPEGDWLQFDNVKGTEKLWLVWSAHPVAELEAARGLINPHDQGEIKNPDQHSAVRHLLEKYADGGLKSVKNSQSVKTNIIANGEILVYPLELQHR